MRFGILGPLRIFREDGTIIQVVQARQRALAAVLLLHTGDSVPTDHLTRMLWDGEPPSRGAIRTHVWGLRKLLRPTDRLARDSIGYRLEVQPDELDLATFRQLGERGLRAAENQDPAVAADLLGRALAVWREPALQDVPATQSLVPVIDRLLDERQTVREALIDVKISLGHHRDLLPEVQAAVTEYPARERFTEQLMLVLYRIGRRAEALNAYRRIHSTLVAEYGIDPGPVLRRLHERILTDDPALTSGLTAS